MATLLLEYRRHLRRKPLPEGHVLLNRTTGYVYVKVSDHPQANPNTGLVPQHRLVMEKKLGRYLKPTDITYHINGDTADNRIENLRVFQNQTELLKAMGIVQAGFYSTVRMLEGIFGVNKFIP